MEAEPRKRLITGRPFEPRSGRVVAGGASSVGPRPPRRSRWAGQRGPPRIRCAAATGLRAQNALRARRRSSLTSRRDALTYPAICSAPTVPNRRRTQPSRETHPPCVVIRAGTSSGLSADGDRAVRSIGPRWITHLGANPAELFGRRCCSQERRSKAAARSSVRRRHPQSGSR